MDKEDIQWVKQTVWNYSHQLLEWCKKESERVSHFEFTGSIYECLEVKNSTQGRCVLMAVLKMKEEDVAKEELVLDLLYKLKESSPENPKFAEFQAGTSSLFSTEKMGKWLEELVQTWIDSGVGGRDVKMSSRQYGAHVQLEIKDRLRGGTVSVDLLPCFEFKDDCDDTHHFIAMSYMDYSDAPSSFSLSIESTLWRRSFAVKEREILQEMDPRKKGCRHDCLRILTVVVSSDRTLRKLSQYHLKTAFLHFQHTETDWRSEQLANRFLGLLKYIHQCVKRKELLHYFLPQNNLLDGYKEKTLEKIERRLLGITSNEKQLLGFL